MYFVKTPKIVRSFFKNYIWHVETDEKILYLTFDDGPTPKVTKFVLDILKKHNAKATFFCVGENIIKHLELFKRIVSEGHTIGNHTQNHLNGWKTNVGDYLANTTICEKVIHQQTYKTQKLFRPPYGKLKNKQARQLINKGFEIIMWSILSGDFDEKITKKKCLYNVISKTEKGAIIVFHDSEKAFEKLKYTLPLVLNHYINKGYSFKEL